MKKLSAKERSRLRYAQREKLSDCRALLIVDNRRIRAPVLRSLKMSFTKIAELQDQISHFVTKEQSLYQDWFNLEFQAEMQQIEVERKKLNTLVDLHNQLLYLVRVKKLSEVAAIRLLDQEEADYQAGNPDQKRAIEELRTQRQQAIDAAIAEEEQGKGHFEEDPESRDEPDPRFDEQTNDLLSLPDRELKRFLRHGDLSVGLLLGIIPRLLELKRPADVRRLLRLSPKVTVVELDLAFEHMLGESLVELLAQLEGDDNTSGGEKTRPHTQKTAEPKVAVAPESKAPSAQEKDHRLVHLFRRIVKLIHPDHADQKNSQRNKLWFERLWKQTLEAKEQKDLETLEVVLNTVLILTEQLDDLTFSELHAAGVSLKSDLKSLQSEVRDLKKHPAWNFSARKTYTDLRKKCEAPFRETLIEIAYEIEDFQDRIDLLRQRAKARIQTKNMSPGKRSRSKKYLEQMSRT